MVCAILREDVFREWDCEAPENASLYFLNYCCKTDTTSLSTYFEPYRHFVAFLKIFCFSDARFDGHNVVAIFGK
jgi:hypothetical protein